MRPEVKRWFKIVFCTLMVVFSVSIGFSDWVYPDDSGDKTRGTKKPEISDKVVCAYFSGNPNKLYSIEDALDKAASNTTAETIFVKPGINPTISRNCTIAKEDTLILPYEEESFGGASGERDHQYPSFADSSDDNVLKNRKSKVTLSANKVLTNYGTLKVGGQVGTQGIEISGMTGGMYSEITLESGASIVNGSDDCQSGTIECYGYIKESSKNNGSSISVKYGLLKEPMVIYDFKGGTYSLKMYGKDVFPFSIYDFPNIQVETSVSYNAEVNIMMTLYAANNFAKFDDCYILSNKNKSLFKLIDANGFVKMKYTSPYWSNKTGEALTTKSHGDENNQSTVITFNGSGRIDSITVNAAKLFGVNLPGIGNVNSSDYFLPISYRYRIIIGAGTFEISNKVRFITGSAMIINKDAQVNFSTAAMFYQSFTDKASVYPYPSKPAAKLICNGKAVFSTWFGGEILTEGSSASLDFKDGFIDNCGNTEMNGDGNTTVNFKAHGKIAVSKTSNDPIDMGFAKNCTYCGNVSYWYYDSINVDQCVSIKEEPKASVKRDGTFSSTGTFNVGVKVSVSSFDTRIINITSVRCSWTVPETNQETMTKIKKTISDDGLSCSITGKVSERKTYTLPVSVEVSFGQYNVIKTINLTIDASCLLYDSLLLMANGTYKKAGEVMPGDMVMSFNHETGKIEPTAVIVNDDVDREATNYNVINLHFSDGTKTSIVSEHGFFNLDLNKYVYIREDNYSQYIGHSFYGINGDGDLSSKKVKLLSVDVEEKFTKVCSPVTANNLNIISDNMLSMAGGIEGLFNFFDYDPVTLKYDEAKKQADIEKYGLLTYEDYKDLLPYEVYEVLPCQYMSVSIGKGLITWDKIKEYINHWSDQLLQ